MNTHHDAEAIRQLFRGHQDRVELLTTLASPANTHLSNAIEQLWMATSAGPCYSELRDGAAAHRRAVDSIQNAWFAMESLVNRTLHEIFRVETSPIYVNQRGTLAKLVSDGLGKNVKFDTRTSFLAENNDDCCDLIEQSKGALRQFERLRNSLVHGYVYRQESLGRVDSSSAHVVTDDKGNPLIVARFTLEHQEIQDAAGNPIAGSSIYRELGISHDETRLCHHDAANCVFRALSVMAWIDNHYGIPSTANWTIGNDHYVWNSRRRITTSRQRVSVLTGGLELYDAWQELENKSKTAYKREKALAVKKNRGGSQRRPKQGHGRRR